VGCGAVVERFHLPAVRLVSDVKLYALVDSDGSRLRRLRLKYPRTRLYRDVSELPADTDAALVAVPNVLHAPISIELLRRGIHVLSEKPMAITVEGCRKMVEASRETDSVLTVGHHKRFVPSIRKAKDLLDEGSIGTVRSITGSMGLPRTWRSRTGFHLDPSRAGGGVLIDSGVHLIDLVIWLIGSMNVLSSCLLPHGNPVEQDAKVEFLTASGAVGVLRFSDRAVLPNVMRIEGDRGFLEFDTYDRPSLKVFAESTRLCRRVGSVVLTWPTTSPYQAQIEHFVRRVRGIQPMISYEVEDAMQAVSAVMRAYERAGRPVS
jgi:predicted dehydrogenase